MQSGMTHALMSEGTGRMEMLVSPESLCVGGGLKAHMGQVDNASGWPIDLFRSTPQLYTLRRSES